MVRTVKFQADQSDIDELKDVEKFNREQGFAANEVDVDAFVDRKGGVWNNRI